LRVASLPAFLIMKAITIVGRDKPKDAYDFCYCLQNFPDGIPALALAWNERAPTRLRQRSIAILREKFAAVDAFGPQQFVEFHRTTLEEERDMHARRAYELVQEFLRQLG
jgi:hypothetical protein